MNPHQVIAGRRNLTVDAADKQNDVPGMDLAGSDAIAPLHAADTAAAFPVAATLFRALDEAGVRYGIIQDLASLPEAVAGCDDLDVLLDKQDYPMFCSIMAELHGRRGVSLSCYDNVCAGREDWFVADFSCGAYLHLDLHVGIRVGWEFRKRYLAFDHAAVGRWEHVFVGGFPSPSSPLRTRFGYRSPASRSVCGRFRGNVGWRYVAVARSNLRACPPPPANRIPTSLNTNLAVAEASAAGFGRARTVFWCTAATLQD